MLGVLFSIIAGATMSLQGVMNTRLGESAGIWISNAFVQGTAFLFALIAAFLIGKGQLSALWQAPKLYWLGGVLGFIITVTVMLGIKRLSPTVAISLILIAQLLVAALIDAFGLLGSEKVIFGWNKYVGIALMMAGVGVFKWL